MGGGWPGWAGCCLFNSAASWRIAAPVNLSGKGAEEPETWLVSCGGCRVSADVSLSRCGSSDLLVEQGPGLCSGAESTSGLV